MRFHLAGLALLLAALSGAPNRTARRCCCERRQDDGAQSSSTAAAWNGRPTSATSRAGDAQLPGPPRTREPTRFEMKLPLTATPQRQGAGLGMVHRLPYPAGDEWPAPWAVRWRTTSSSSTPMSCVPADLRCRVFNHNRDAAFGSSDCWPNRTSAIWWPSCKASSNAP